MSLCVDAKSRPWGGAGFSSTSQCRTGDWRKMYRLLPPLVLFMMFTEARAWCWLKLGSGTLRGADAGWWCTNLYSSGETRECSPGYYCPGG